MGAAWVRIQQLRLRLTEVALRNRWIILILLLALSLRLAWLSFAEPLPISDFREYLELARGIADHAQYGYPEPTAYRLPFFPAILALILLVRDSVFWLSAFNVILSTAICFLIYRVTRRVSASRETALVAAGIAAIYPQFVFLSPVLASEHLLIVLVLSAFLVGTGPLARRPWGMLSTGAVIGFATLTRGDGAIFGIVVLGFSMAPLLVDKRHGWRRVIRCAGAFMAGAVLVVLPWIIRNEVVMGPGTGPGGNAGQAFWYGHNPEGYGFVPVSQTPMAGLGERELQRKAWELALTHIRENPESLVDSMVNGTLQIFAPNMQESGLFWSTRNSDRQVAAHVEHLYAPFRGLSVAGAWALLIVPLLSFLNIKAVGRSLVVTAAAFVGTNWLFYAVAFLGHPRYRFVADIFLAMLAAGVIRVVAESHTRPSSHRGANAAAQHHVYP